jgi:hypothetical protein
MKSIALILSGIAVILRWEVKSGGLLVLRESLRRRPHTSNYMGLLTRLAVTAVTRSRDSGHI